MPPPDPNADTLHATLIAGFVDDAWRGILLLGPSGAGKSTLALRALEAGFRLVADDRVVVWASGNAAYGKAPTALAGLIEVRGLGVIKASAPALPLCRIARVMELSDTPPAAMDRMPEARFTPVCGVPIPTLSLSAADPHAPLRLRVALAAVQHGL